MQVTLLVKSFLWQLLKYIINFEAQLLLIGSI